MTKIFKPNTEYFVSFKYDESFTTQVDSFSTSTSTRTAFSSVVLTIGSEGLSLNGMIEDLMKAGFGPGIVILYFKELSPKIDTSFEVVTTDKISGDTIANEEYKKTLDQYVKDKGYTKEETL